MIRLFVAIPLPESVRAYLLRLQTGIRSAAWQRDDQLHLTLNFIGPVDGGMARDIDMTLQDLRSPAFTIRLDGAGLFGSMDKPRVLWAGATPREPLSRLHDKIGTALQKIGVPRDERKYAPHVTLARLRDSRAAAPGVLRFLDAHGGLMTADFTVRQFALYSSHLATEGASYHIEALYDLDGQPDFTPPDFKPPDFKNGT